MPHYTALVTLLAVLFYFFVGTRVAAVCLYAIGDPGEPNAEADRLSASRHEIVELTPAQLDEFPGNLLELRARRAEALYELSEPARRA